jgi:hypothetical protein
VYIKLETKLEAKSREEEVELEIELKVDLKAGLYLSFLEYNKYAVKLSPKQRYRLKYGQNQRVVFTIYQNMKLFIHFISYLRPIAQKNTLPFKAKVVLYSLTASNTLSSYSSSSGSILGIFRHLIDSIDTQG